MNFRKSAENNITSQELLEQASRCKPEELEGLLNQIQIKLEQTNNKNGDYDILRAKTIITSRLASMRSK